METIGRVGLFAAAMLLGCCAVHADDYDWEDIFAPYRQRIDAATTSSGNAHNVNAATQIITPWPRNVLNRRIPGDGARMVGAVKRYREPNAQADTAPSRPQARPAPAPTPAAAAGGEQSGGAGAAQAGAAAPSAQSSQ